MNAADAAPLTPPPEYATGQISGAWQPPRRTSRRKTSFSQIQFCEKLLTGPCEEKLKVLIEEMKSEIKAEKEMRKEVLKRSIDDPQ